MSALTLPGVDYGNQRPNGWAKSYLRRAGDD